MATNTIEITSDQLIDPACQLCENKPVRTLGCDHCFCQECIDGIRKSNSILANTFDVRCPLCRHVSQLEEKDPPSCDRCKNKLAEFGCTTCKGNLCLTCWDIIHSFGELVNHPKTNLGSIWYPRKFCTQEGHELVEISMVSQDDKGNIIFCCPKCILEQDLEHIETFRESALEHREHIKMNKMALQDRILILDEKIRYLQDLEKQIEGDDMAKPEIKGSIESAVDQIMETFDQIQKRLFAYRDEIIADLKDLGRQKLEIITKSEKNLSEAIKSGIEGYKHLDTVLQAVDDYSFLVASTKFETEFKELVNKLDQMTIPVIDSNIHIKYEKIRIPLRTSSPKLEVEEAIIFI